MTLLTFRGGPTATQRRVGGTFQAPGKSLLSGSMTPLPTSWVIQCTGGSFDGDSSTPSGSAGGLLDTKDLIDKIARLQAVAEAVMHPPPGLAIQESAGSRSVPRAPSAIHSLALVP
ncbi:hypothetical protein AK812_SmicGene45014, partial [Symbiodinium microadriaticum]